MDRTMFGRCGVRKLATVAVILWMSGTQQLLADESLLLEGSNPRVILNQNTATPVVAWHVRALGQFFEVFNQRDNTRPFSIYSGAKTDSLAVNAGGVGIGIAYPQRSMHIRTVTDLPTVRFEDRRDLLPQTWDVVGDNSAFYVKDFSRNRFPFTVITGAPTNGLFVDKTGSIGMGTNEPQKIRGVLTDGKLLNVTNVDAGVGFPTARIVAQGNAGGLLELVHLNAAGNQKILRLSSYGGFAKFQTVTDSLQAILQDNMLVMRMGDGYIGMGVANPNNPLHMKSGARCTAGGTWTNASSRELKQDIEPLTSEQARDAVARLQPVGFRYKNELDERYCGFIAEDVPELVATNDRKALCAMDVVAVLTKVVQDQQIRQQQQEKLLDEQRRTLESQQALLVALTRRLAEVETTRGNTTAPE